MRFGTFRLALALSLSGALVPPQAAGSEEKSDLKQIIIGVLAKRGEARCAAEWAPTAAHLSAAIPGADFTILPLDFDEIYTAVKEQQVHFVLANPAFYVGLESECGCQRIATMKNRGLDRAYTQFGGVLFCRADREDIGELASLRGKRFMAVDQRSFGGWYMSWRTLVENGIRPCKDFQSLDFGGTHDAVVAAVQAGRADAGAVRSDTLERMAQEGSIALRDFKVLHTQAADSDFPFLHSTPLYPEWPFAKTAQTDDQLAEAVSIALLRITPESPAALAARCAGWTIPLNYQPVHECLKALQVWPYQDYGHISLGAVCRQYGLWLLFLLLSLLAISLLSALLYRKNRELREAIQNIKTLYGIIPICVRCKKIRDDAGYWRQVETYIAEHSEAVFSHGLCSDCATELYPELVEEGEDPVTES